MRRRTPARAVFLRASIALLVLVTILLATVGGLRPNVLVGRALGHLATLQLHYLALAAPGQDASPTNYPSSAVAAPRLPHFGIIDPARVAPARSTFVSALAYAPEQAALHRGIGRLAFVSGDATTAAYHLNRLGPQLAYDALLYEELLLALSYAMPEQPAYVIDLYERVSPPHLTTRIRDAVALAYLTAQPPGYPAAVLAVRPHDLTARLRLWEQAVEAGDRTAAETHRQALVQFVEPSIDPTDERLLPFVLTTIPRLREAGIWSAGLTAHVADFLVLRHSATPALAPFLTALETAYPEQATWPLLRAEHHVRRGELDVATELYERLAARLPEQPIPLLQFARATAQQATAARLPSERITLWQQAIQQYAAYLAHLPADLLAFSQLTKGCVLLAEMGATAAGCQQVATRAQRQSSYPGEQTMSAPATLQAVLAYRTDKRRIAAEILDIPRDAIMLGANLVRTSPATEWATGWQWVGVQDRSNVTPGTFAGGIDSHLPFAAPASARIDGFWREPAADQPEAMGVFVYGFTSESLSEQVIIEAQQVYMVYLVYRTNRIARDDVQIGHWEAPHTWGASLPPTGQQWVQAVVIVQNQSPVQVFLRLRLMLMATGTVAFDEVSMYPLTIDAAYAEQLQLERRQAWSEVHAYR